MEEKDKISKAKKKLITLLLIYLSIAFVFIGAVFFLRFFSKEESSVTLDINTLPVLMTSVSGSSSNFYYITDVNNHIYIVDLSHDTFKSIANTLDLETGKLKSTYQIKGSTNTIDEQIKTLALSNSFKVFKNKELNLDNFSEYLGELYIKENYVNPRIVTISTILALLSVFFLILAFGYIVPAIVNVSKGKFGIFSDKNMRLALEKHLPDGETLTAGIHGIGIQTEIKQVFGKCICVDDKLIPSETGTALQVTKSKFSRFDVYIGITQHYFILSECEAYKHFYEFNDVPDLAETAKEIDTCIPLADIGTCFPFAEIQSCTFKNAFAGNINCSITMKNGSLLKLMLPKQGGLGMSHHAEHREAIVACLRNARNK